LADQRYPLLRHPSAQERAILVHLSLSSGDEDSRDLEEFQELAASAGASCGSLVTGLLRSPDPRLFAGAGKVEEIRLAVSREQAQLVIFNHALSPSQERNLEALFQCRVVDRTRLILDIFAQRARSFEGKLQVELAQLRHLSTRLVRGWTHLERQKGGIGLRGPGETQLETDRRLIAERIRRVRLCLQRVDRQRSQGRQSRYKAEIPTVSLVGYTNAGKSTLFNLLTNANVYAADELFATLDPTLRRLSLPNGDSAILVDTVGFISNLPHELIAAFRSTLQETCEAKLLLHVVDASVADCRTYMEQVEKILEEIGANSIPRIEVFNKIDRTGDVPRSTRAANGKTQAVWVSAAEGLGTDLLRRAVAEHLRDDTVHGWIQLPVQAGRLRARLFSLGAVIAEHPQENGHLLLEVQTSKKNLSRLCRREGFQKEWLRFVG
jgi:GTP-binding protein HflX